jgi:hypothetical protein
MNNLIFSFLSLAAVWAQAAHADANAPRFCSFSYTEKVRDDGVIPILKKEFGEGYRFFNYEDPFLLRDYNTVQIRVRAVKTINGSRLLDENPIVIMIDACSDKVVRYYIINEYQKDK